MRAKAGRCANEGNKKINMKTIEKISVSIIVVNLLIWISTFWKKLDAFYFFAGIFTILISYVIVYSLIRVVMGYYAESVGKSVAEYFHKNFNTKNVQFSGSSFNDESRKYSSIIFIGLLCLDSFALYKLEISILSVASILISNGAYNR